MKYFDKKNFLLLAAFLYVASISSEPVAHHHYDEDHADETCLVCHFAEVSPLEKSNEVNISFFYISELKGIYKNFYISKTTFPYSSRAPPRI